MPNQNLVLNMAVPSASMSLINVPVSDAHDIKNALTGGPTVPATISWDIKWSGFIKEVTQVDASKGFVGFFHRDTATIRWSAKQDGFSFVSDPATSTFAELGHVNNNLGAIMPATVP
jgi:hypothetical protein